jgi:excisionase family DNA binding protein
MDSEQKLFGFAYAAIRLGCSYFTVRRRVEAGDIKSVNIGARRLIHLDEILRVEAEGAGKLKPANNRRSKARRGSAAASR